MAKQQPFGEWARKRPVLKEADMDAGVDDTKLELLDMVPEDDEIYVYLRPAGLPDDQEVEIRARLENIRAEDDGDETPYVDYTMVNADTDEPIPLDSLTSAAHEHLTKLLDASPVVSRILSNNTDNMEYERGEDRHQDRMDRVVYEGVDAGVANWLGRFKSYDELRTARHPVREQLDKMDIPAVQRKETGDKDWKTTLCDLDKARDSKMSDSRSLAKKSDALLKEPPDSDVISWMGRFSRLDKKR